MMLFGPFFIVASETLIHELFRFVMRVFRTPSVQFIVPAQDGADLVYLAHTYFLFSALYRWLKDYHGSN